MSLSLSTDASHTESKHESVPRSLLKRAGSRSPETASKRVRFADDQMIAVQWSRFAFKTLESAQPKVRIRQLAAMIQQVQHRRWPILVLHVAPDVSADQIAFLRLVGVTPASNEVYGNFIGITPEDFFQPIFKDGSDEFTQLNQYPVPVESVMGYFGSVVDLPVSEPLEGSESNPALPLFRSFLRLFRKDWDNLPSADSGVAHVKSRRVVRWERNDRERLRQAELEFGDSDDERAS